MKTYLTAVVILISTASVSMAAKKIFERGNPVWVKTTVLIAASLRDYDEAERFAVHASWNLGYKLNYRGLHPYGLSGLSLSAEECEQERQVHPCYLARGGQWDDGAYISIERSDAYQLFQPGYYIVVVASGHEVNDAIIKTKKIYPDAYVKSGMVFMGYMH